MTATITDFNQFTGLRAAADQNDPAALREVASQFEALFLQTMLKNMREASLGDPIFGNSDQQEMYQGMMDQQLALEMASGKGVGLADMLVRQLGGGEAEKTFRPDRDFPLTNVARNHTAVPLHSPVQLQTAVPLQAVPPSVSATPSHSPAPVNDKPAWSDPKAFVRDIWPHAERAGRRLNVAPEAIVAQAALETGWGAHVMPDTNGDSSFNLFGIKAGGGWRGDQVSRQTLEFENGVPRPQKAQFRSYGNVAAVFNDYTEFLTDNPRYSAVSGHGDDVAGFANALQSAGYATDPKYADKLTRVLNSPTMQSVMRALKNSVVAPIKAQLSLHAQ
jgi:flagellar protein FlgJ